uniref:Uncharacterized protein n=1 Tax=Anguilla anguilla TaxID=7936 RepID=A0A0E9TBK5_ANGAN
MRSYSELRNFRSTLMHPN